MDRIIRVTGELVVEERWDEEFFVGLYHMTYEITGPSLLKKMIYFLLLVFAFADDLALPTETLTIKSGSLPIRCSRMNQALFYPQIPYHLSPDPKQYIGGLGKAGSKQQRTDCLHSFGLEESSHRTSASTCFLHH